MILFTIFDRVEICDSTDDYLDGSRGQVVGYHHFDQIHDPSYIVLFENPPQGYSPAIVIAGAYLKRI